MREDWIVEYEELLKWRVSSCNMFHIPVCHVAIVAMELFGAPEFIRCRIDVMARDLLRVAG